MKVLLICGAGIISGKEIMCLHLLRELKIRGHKCSVVTSDWGSDDFKTKLNNLSIPYESLRIGFISKTLTWPAIRMTLIQTIYMPSVWIRYFLYKRKIHPDVVIHTNFHHAFLLHPIVGKERNLFWLHDIVGQTNFYRRLFHLLSKKTECFIPVSNATSSSLIRLGIEKSKISVIKNGALKPTSFSSERNRQNPPFIFAVIGQVSHAKGLEVVIRGFYGLPKEFFRLKIIGKGSNEYIAYLKLLCIELGLTDNCEWVGFVDDIEKIYQGVDVVVVPSIFPDPYPTTVMEAGLRGIPTIASTSGGLPEMISEGINGFLFESGDAHALQQSIIKIFNYKNLDTLKSKTLSYANQSFKMDQFVDKFENLILEGK